MRNIVLVVLLYSLFCTGYVAAQVFAAPGMAAKEQAAKQASSDRDASAAVARRVDAGDKQALSELAGMDPVVAVPILANSAKDCSADAERAAIALTTLKKVRGIRDYFRPRIAFLHAQVGGDFDTLDEFETLSLISTKDAVAAAAPFLFDNTGFKNPEPNSDVGASSLRYQAVSSLLKMKLADAPTQKSIDEVDNEDIQAWRAWWTAHKAEYEI